jgi:hypothetical protein
MNVQTRAVEWRRSDSGNSATEFALILPLLALLLFGLYDMGRLFWTFHIASASVRDAARYAARLSWDCANMPTSTSTYWAPVRDLARTGSVGGGTSLIPGWLSSDITVTPSCGANSYAIPNSPPGTFSGRYEGFANIPSIQVRASAPFSPLFLRVVPGWSLTRITVIHSEVWTG